MAGDAKGIRAGRAFVEVGVSDGALSKGLKRAAGRLKAFGASIAAIGSKMAMVGGAALAPLLGTSKVFADMGSNLWDMSKRTGVTVEALSVLGYAAQQSGADISSLETGLRKMQKTITDAAQGSQSAKDALAALGLTVQDIINLAPEEQFKVLANQLDKVADPTQKAALAMDVFGKSGTALLPMIEGGASALNEYEQAAKRLGLVMSTADAKAADEFGDKLDDLLKTVKMAVFHVGAALAPALQKVAGQLIVAAKAASDWVTQNQGVVVGALQAAAAVTGVGLAMLGIGKIITGASLALKVVGVAVAILGSPIAIVAIGISAIAGALAYAGLAGDTFSAKMENLKSMVLPLVQATVEYIGVAWEWLVAAVQPILATFSASVTTCFAAIWTTLQPLVDGARDMILAAWAFISPYITPILNWMQGAIVTAFAAIAFAVTNWKATLEYALVAAAYGVVKFANTSVYFFTTMIPGYLAWFRDNWRDVFQTIWNGMKTFASNVWTNLKNLWTAIKGLFAGEGFNFQWTGLMDGFESTIKELPKIAAREIGPLEKDLGDQMDKLGGELATDWEAYRKNFSKTVEATVNAPGASAPASVGPVATDQVAKAADKLKGVGKDIPSIYGDIKTAGTFNASAIQSLQSGGSVVDRIARATEQTAKNTKNSGQAAFT